MRKLDPTERLDQASGPALGTRVHEVLHARVDDLADLVLEAGFRRPTKRELLSALILGAAPDPEELNRLVVEFQGATVADARLGEPGNVIEIKDRKVGRPRH